MSDARRVLVTGTFDVENYGDLLFPIVAAHELGSRGFGVVPVSPTGAAVTGLADAPRPVTVAEMMSGEAPIAGILIGGGYIVHHHSASVLSEYESAGVADWAYAGLWLGATAAAALRDVPVAWNAPGAPVPFGGAGRRALIGSMLRAATYVSVRDPGSLEFLGQHEGVDIRVVPDTVLGLARAWPREALADACRTLAARKGISAGTRWLAVHLRMRTLGQLQLADLARSIDAIAARWEVTPLLIALGRSLDDAAAVSALSDTLRCGHVRLDDPTSLKEIAAAIAFSRAYVGASMHGYVTACAYDVPGVMVARPAHRKFGGLVSQLGRRGDLAQDWTSALDAVERHMAATPSPRIPASVRMALDQHWSEIGRALEDTREAAERRRRFLVDYLRSAIGGAGAAWAFQPFVSARR
ncbi:polysaccharide pyruvyl transferase family protein [Propylenella binzhouense]|uniref:Polysaccharide pyruvyl transferase family protein n=1 Tax=Propylenella binzhouense TaxID=2555902 RepID=A0A964T190_9HYPH|nr:polysaccharide pyruvyl transferase family protein [Propylenella binzhouense]MYZ46568.1 polysaccharide pyruvyl transferase family protein [Propylenella binzhouense]